MIVHSFQFYFIYFQINVRAYQHWIKIVLLMSKFESPVVVRRKLQIELGKDTPIETCIKYTFDRFCGTSRVKDRESPGRLPKITEEKINEVRDFIQHEPQSPVRAVATDRTVSHATAHRIMRDYLGLKP